MSVQAEDLVWQDEFGNEIPAADFIMRHTSTHVWEQLGVYPQAQDHSEDGIYMREVELAPDLMQSFKISVNKTDSTFNVEVFKDANEQHNLVYSKYLIPVERLNHELITMQEAFNN